MRCQLELDIDLPRDRVVELFLDPENLPKWQPDLVSFEPVGGGGTREVGAQSKQIHKMGEREVEIVETITVANHPEEYAATYEADGMWNLVENRFLDVGERKTKWMLKSECKVSGIVTKIMAFLFPGMFKKQTLTFMERFKEFAESSGG